MSPHLAAYLATLLGTLAALACITTALHLWWTDHNR